MATVPLVLTVLMILMGILIVTANLSLSARRTTADQRFVLAAQYAADSGMARAKARLYQFRQVLNGLALKQTLTDIDLRNFIAQICGVSVGSLPNFSSTATLSSTGAVFMCNVQPSGSLAAALTNTNYVDTSVLTAAYNAAGVKASEQATYLSALTSQGMSLGGALDATGNLNREMSASLQVQPLSVYQVGLRAFKVFLQTKSMSATGTATPTSGTSAAARRVVQAAATATTPGFGTTGSDPSTAYGFVVQRAGFNQYVFFRNNTNSVSGSPLYLSAGETFDGPVHTNGTLHLSGAPVFQDRLTSASANWDLSGSPCSQTQLTTQGGCPSMTPNYAAAVVPTVPLPSNNNNQLRASFGGDPADSSTVTAAQLAASWNVPNPVAAGIYYSKGNGTTSNQQSTWNSQDGSNNGGIYINGDVDSIVMSKNGNYQRITIVQGGVTTRFDQTASGWQVYVSGSLQKTMTGSFNGMLYVNGKVNSLTGGGGNTSASIASGVQLTLATTGTIKIKDSITYTDDPNSPGTTNVLGIYSQGGSVLLDGPQNQNLNIDASIMATATGQGFGSVGTATNGGGGDTVQGTPKPYINLRGGLIEDQSQTVSSGSGGYLRSYKYDQRAKSGFAPPFFPLQQRWSAAFTDTPQLGTWGQSQ